MLMHKTVVRPPATAHFATMNPDKLAGSWRDATLANGAGGQRAGPPHAAKLDSQLHDDGVWLLLEKMPFKDMRSFFCRVIAHSGGFASMKTTTRNSQMSRKQDSNQRQIHLHA